MTPEAELIKIRDEVHRKIGRNLLLIQGIEYVLKRMIVLNGLTVKASGDNRKERLAAVSKKTMGTLVGEFYESYYFEQGEISKKEEEVQEVQISINAKIKSEELKAKSQKSLSSIVDERNKLVHHFLQELNEGIKGWEDADLQLEKQYSNLTHQYKHLVSLHDSVRQSFIKMLSAEWDFVEKEPGELNS